MTKIKVFPNFWQALLYNYLLPIIIGIIIGLILIFVFKVTIPFKELQIFTKYFGHIITIPFILFFLWKSKIKINWSEFTTLNLKNLIIIIPLAIGVEILFFGTIHLFERLFSRNYPSLMTKSTYYLSVIHALIAAPIIEEILYRRIFLHQFLRQYSSWVAILFSTVIFVIPHVPTIIYPELFIPYFISGLFLGFVYYKTQSVLLCMISHFIFNAITYLPIDSMFK
jgi:membrane protease YdiL (CAAX protease family)